jgi:putative SOS response-associated peptidase YedK
MAVIVEPRDCQRWLDPENENVSGLRTPTPSKGWIAYPVNRRVSSPKNEGPSLIDADPV